MRARWLGWVAGQQGVTYNIDGAPSVYYSVVVKDQFQHLGGTSGPIAADTLSVATVHEAGHQLDYLYSNVVKAGFFASESTANFVKYYTGTKFQVFGYNTIRAGDVLKVIISGNGITGTTPASYTVATIGQSATDVAHQLALAINNTYRTYGIEATNNNDATPPVATSVITVKSAGGVKFTPTYVDINPADGTALWYAAGQTTLQYDFNRMNGKAACGSAGAFYQTVDSTGAYICTSSGTGTTLSSTYSGLTLNSDILQKA